MSQSNDNSKKWCHNDWSLLQTKKIRDLHVYAAKSKMKCSVKCNSTYTSMSSTNVMATIPRWRRPPTTRWEETRGLLKSPPPTYRETKGDTNCAMLSLCKIWDNTHLNQKRPLDFVLVRLQRPKDSPLIGVLVFGTGLAVTMSALSASRYCAQHSP
jgi:hypothetical protein